MRSGDDPPILFAYASHRALAARIDAMGAWNYLGVTMPSTPTTIHVPDDLRARLVAQAADAGKPINAYMLEALKEKLDRADRRREYLEAGEEVLRDYERTGIAYPMEVVEKYMVEIAAGKKPCRPMPIKVRGKP